jgi:hypothetical protein
LATSGAPDERKSHEAMSAAMSSMDPNETMKALKKLTACPFVDLGDRLEWREGDIAVWVDLKTRDVDRLPDMVERDVFGKEDGNLRIEASDFDRTPGEFAIEIEVDPSIPISGSMQCSAVVSLFDSAPATDPSTR